MLKNVADKILKNSTPKYAYKPNEQTLNDGVYIFRMAPFTDVNDQGGVWFPNVVNERDVSAGNGRSFAHWNELPVY